MLKILKFSFADLIRSRWTVVYFLFYLVLGFSVLFLFDDLGKAILTFMNVIVVLTPLIGTVFGVMYHYHSREFTTLLLAQPIRRTTIFLGQYIGLSLSLSLSLVLGLLIPFMVYGVTRSAEIWDFVSLIGVGVLLTFIFIGFAFNIALRNENRIRGFGYAILTWLFFAIIYDGLFLIALVVFDDYPLDKAALVATTLNPVDLSRILILLKLDISALLGYTGAVFQKFFGTNLGLLSAVGILLAWVVIPAAALVHKARVKDF